MQFLEVIARALDDCGDAVLFYLAAAVSDYYIPWERMVRRGRVRESAGARLHRPYPALAVK